MERRQKNGPRFESRFFPRDPGCVREALIRGITRRTAYRSSPARFNGELSQRKAPSYTKSPPETVSPIDTRHTFCPSPITEAALTVFAVTCLRRDANADVPKAAMSTAPSKQVEPSVNRTGYRR